MENPQQHMNKMKRRLKDTIRNPQNRDDRCYIIDESHIEYRDRPNHSMVYNFSYRKDKTGRIYLKLLSAVNRGV